MNKRYFLGVAVIAALGCASLAAGVLVNDNIPAVTVEGNELHYFDGGKSRILHQADAEIETMSADDNWLVWSVDDDPRLWLGRLSGKDLQAKPMTTLPHDLDLLCVGRLDDKTFDLFIHDGDKQFYHYWLSPDLPGLRLVRRIATNPDISACKLSAERLQFIDPYIGVLWFDRNPETDPILHSIKEMRDVLAEQMRDSENRYAVGHRLESPEKTLPVIRPQVETEPVNSANDAADDPVVLVGSKETWVVGTDKKAGLAVYNLGGMRIHFNARGRLNNVDAIPLGEQRFVLAASNRTEKTIDLFVADISANSFHFHNSVPLALDDPYGLCMSEKNGQVSVFASDTEGLVEQWQLRAGFSGADRVRQFRFDTQTEGCVVDSAAGYLYVGEEGQGLWQVDLSNGDRSLIETLGNSQLVADLEGIDIYHGTESYMVVSSQGDNAYGVFQLRPWKLLGKFRVGADYDRGIDGASETDGLAVSSLAIPGYPSGLLVVQDGRNRAPDDNQNFKLVDWRDVQRLIDRWEGKENAE